MSDLTSETLKVARNIVNQILDESGADVATRQRINDDCDAFVVRLIEKLVTDTQMMVREHNAELADMTRQRDEAVETVTRVRRALDDELQNLADDGARLSHSVVRRIEAALSPTDPTKEHEPQVPPSTWTEISGYGIEVWHSYSRPVTLWQSGVLFRVRRVKKHSDLIADLRQLAETMDNACSPYAHELKELVDKHG